jgi:hypothetical protein
VNECECHGWYPLAEIGGWTQRNVLVRDWAAKPEIWDPRRHELSHEELRERITAAGGVQCEYALSATRNLDGSIELDKGVHRWTVAAELGVSVLPVRVTDAADSPLPVPW